MRVILTGGGSGKDTLKIDKLFSQLVDKSKPLLYIPVAIDNIKHPYEGCLKWLKSTFDSLGINNYLMWTEEDLSKSINISPKDFGGIYIGGGNTHYLLDVMNKSGFSDFLKKAVKENIPIYGGSAGAIVLGKSLANARPYDKDWNRIGDVDGLNLANNLSIACHYSPQEKEKLEKIFRSKGLKKSILLSEKSAIFVSDEGIKVIGEDAILLTEKAELKIKENGFVK